MTRAKGKRCLLKILEAADYTWENVLFICFLSSNVAETSTFSSFSTLFKLGFIREAAAAIFFLIKQPDEKNILYFTHWGGSGQDYFECEKKHINIHLFVYIILLCCVTRLKWLYKCNIHLGSICLCFFFPKYAWEQQPIYCSFKLDESDKCHYSINTPFVSLVVMREDHRLNYSSKPK